MYSAHKLVLSICSTYFNELFTPKPENKNLNSEKEKIQIIRPNVIESFVETYYRRVNQGGAVSVANSAFEIKM